MKDVLPILANASLKTPDFVKLVENLRVWKAHSELNWALHYSRRRARLSFNVHCRRQQCLSRFFTSLSEGLSKEKKSQVVVGYGAAKFAPTGSGEMAVPTTSAFKVCAKTWPTKLVNEFRTTIMCHDCEGRLRQVRRRGNNGTLLKNRGLLHCQNGCRSLPLKNRDLNAAKNIALITVRDGDRPAFLSRN
jgi:hypothetical protein